MDMKYVKWVFRLCLQKQYKKHFKVVCIRRSEKWRKCRREMALSLTRFWISFWKQQPFVLLWATSASKIRCKVSLCVTVKGHWERSATFTASLHCISGIAPFTHYLQADSTDRQPRHPPSILLPYGQRCLLWFLLLFFFFLFFFTKENWTTAHTAAALLSRAEPATGPPCLKLQFPGTWL